ncbi:hypothetical protein [Natronorubrum sp. DTA7]|uniref:hypothetical protein n=1 Tax=Natronorubrum sp. DTA7 TaxID=3447016 RepID=UPI003F8399A7
MEEDWDNLIILDACRYDAYEEMMSNKNVPDILTDGELPRYKISNATESWDFMSRNFSGFQHYDTVYITANPFATRLESGTFFLQKNLVESKWNDKHDTVLPEDVVDTTTDIFDEHPNKRYVVHFMQPHYPFIGPKGDRIDHTGYNRDQENPEQDAPNVWWILQYGLQGYDGVTQQNVWEAYTENLELVLRHVRDLLEQLPGRSVITADHGTMIGDRVPPIPVRGYGHAHGSFVPPVVKVPWHVIENGERREITADTPLEAESVDSDVVNDRLEMLGYRA